MATVSQMKRKGVNKIELAEERIVDVAQDFQHLKILIYGRAKKGKTTFGASGPKPVLIVDCNERGTLSVRGFSDVKVFRLERWVDIDLAFWFLHSGKHDFQTVVVDTVTSLQMLCMKFVLGDEASRDPTKDPMMPGKRDYGKVAELMKTQLVQFRNLPMNVVFVAQEKRGFTEDEEDAPQVFPEISPSIRSALTPAVDIIGRLYVKEVVTKKGGKQVAVMERRLLIGDHEIYDTGDRSESGLPSVVRLTDREHSLERLIRRIQLGKKEEAVG